MGDGETPIRYRVLVVLADESVGERLVAALRAAVHSDLAPVLCSSLDESVGLLRGERFDAVLAGLDLPDSSGRSTYQRLREAVAEAPLILLVGSGERALARAALRDGADAFLTVDDLAPQTLELAIETSIERWRAVEGLRRREARLDLVLRGTAHGAWDWDVDAGRVFYSAQWNAILGLPARDVVEEPGRWLDRIHTDDRDGFDAVLRSQLRSGAGRFRHEHRVVAPAGDYRWIQACGTAVRDLTGRVRRMAGTVCDITERKRAEERLTFSAMHDELTGLANRAVFLDHVEMALAGLRRQQRPHFTLLFIDLDRFKQVNDVFGHHLGDLLLTEVARRLRDVLRPGDTIARLAGDEFAVLLGDVGDVRAAIHVADRVLEVFASPFRLDGHDVSITASVGIALSHVGYRTPSEILHHADIAMFRAKSSGRGQCHVFDPELHRRAVDLLRMESELRRAVDSGSFVMHYQPIVSLVSGQVVGFEGMVRWAHPERGLVTPTEFLAVAEESGLMVPIGWWALRQACRQTRLWHRRHQLAEPPWVSVNVSDMLFMRGDLADGLGKILHDTELPPRALRLELNESAVTDHAEAAAKRLGELESLGVRVALDDFGAGPSSLTSLHRFRYDALKLDPSFVRGSVNGGGATPIVRSVLTVASSLGMGVVAEGIETAGQAERMRQLRCPHGQGFWFARPATAEEAERLLLKAPERWRGRH